jgi:hypothetical protein
MRTTCRKRRSKKCVLYVLSLVYSREALQAPYMLYAVCAMQSPYLYMLSRILAGTKFVEIQSK